MIIFCAHWLVQQQQFKQLPRLFLHWYNRQIEFLVTQCRILVRMAATVARMLLWFSPELEILVNVFILLSKNNFSLLLIQIKFFWLYLFGNKFTLYTYHKPLVWLYSLKKLNSSLIRWKLKLEGTSFQIKHFKDKENHVNDAPSRIKINALSKDFDNDLIFIPL